MNQPRFLPVIILAVILLLMCLEPASAAQRRTALVIGNAAYKKGSLRNPVNDATDMASTLRKLGFSVTLLKNARLRSMEEALTAFNRKLRRGGLGLFYFAGHGVNVEGENYLIPIGTRIDREQDVRYEAMPVGQVLGAMEDAENGTNIVILDACRNNPFARRWRSSQRGLAVVQAAQGTLIAYATEPGGVAIDGYGRNGIYTKHLLKKMQTPDLPVEQVLKQVRIGVMEETQRKQIPWESSSLTGDVYLLHGALKYTPADAPQQFQPASPDPEVMMWNMVKDSTYPEDIRDFLAVYPDGQYAAVARLKLKQLTRQKAATPYSAPKKRQRQQNTPPLQAARPDPEAQIVASHIQMLRSPDPVQQRQGAITVYRSQYLRHPEILAVAAEELLSSFNRNLRNRTHVDAMAWLCKILGAAGDRAYYTTLQTVANEAGSRKIRKYAKKYSARLR